MLPRYVVMGIAGARDRTIYLTAISPFTLHRLKIPRDVK